MDVDRTTNIVNPTTILLLLALVAFAYAMVGHGGASGYLALLSLAGYAAEVIKPSALLLNLFVSAIAFIQFARAGHFKWKLFWPFALGSVPAAWLGARIALDPLWYQRILGILLLFAVARLLWQPKTADASPTSPPLAVAIAIGIALGIVSGMIGIGGGIILSPLLLLLRWADVKTTAATSAIFIFVNSASGLLSLSTWEGAIDPQVYYWCTAAVVGGTVGSWLGSRRIPPVRLRQALGLVLLFASIKLIFVA
jgi:uncharacterized membrane protein YfcA